MSWKGRNGVGIRHSDLCAQHRPTNRASPSGLTRGLCTSRCRHGGYVYILANMRRGRTYIGVTNDLVRRVYEHREGLVEGYTKSRNIKRLVYFEQLGDISMAIQRETSLKRWYSHWKQELIERNNPEWRDLWDDIAK